VVVYADLIFLFNFFMDAGMLLVTARVRKVKTQWWRLAISAAMGASSVMLMFVPSLSLLFTFSVKCIFSFLMIMTAFGFGSLQNFVRNLGTFFLVNFATAGGIFGFHYFMESSGEIMNGIMFTQSGGLAFQFEIGGILLILLLAAVMLWWFRTIFHSAKQREELTSYLANVQIHIDGFTSSCTGLIDTGNQLYDPLTRTPVMVMEAAEWKEILPEAWLARIRSSEVDQIISGLGTDEFIWQDRLRLVPYRGVNRNTQFMLAIKPDKVVITHNDKQMDATKVLIGLDGGKLCSDGSYQAIIHPTLIAVI
jgi:stage II sporulation protein GA (sporulation sigma-E factor processing peptidase)